MQMFAFWKRYYQRTDRMYADGNRNKEECERARQKGQMTKTSKRERKVFLIAQYFLLLLCWVPLVWMHQKEISVFMLALSFLFSGITDFSVLKVERLRRIFNKGTVSGELLQRAFFGEMDGFFSALQKQTKLYTTGYVRKDNRKFRVHYAAVCRSRENAVLLKLTPRAVVVTINGKTFRFAQAYPSVEELLSNIADTVCDELKR